MSTTTSTGPISEFVIEADYIDMNGHMNFVHYHTMFKLHLDRMVEWLDLGESYRATRGCAIFIAESHTLYEQELVLGERCRVGGKVLEIKGKRLRLACEMMIETGARAALFEVLFINVDRESRRANDFSEEVLRRVEALVAATMPQGVGRHVGAPRKSTI